MSYIFARDDAQTKIIIFNESGKILKGFSFMYNGQTVEIVSINIWVSFLNRPVRSLRL